MPWQRMAKKRMTGVHARQKSARRSDTTRQRSRFKGRDLECGSVGSAEYSDERNTLSGIHFMTVVLGRRTHK